MPGRCLALLPLFLHWRAAARELGLRPWWEICRILPRPQSWLNMGADSLLYGRIAGQRLFADMPTANEQIIGIGFLTPLATLIGLLIWRRKEWVKLLLAVSALVVALTTLWMGKYTLWRVVYDAYPAAGAVRAVARAGCYVDPRLVGTGPTGRGRLADRAWLMVMIAMACLLEQARPRRPRQVQYALGRRRGRHAGRPNCKAFYLTAYNTSLPEWQINMDAVWAAAVTGVPTVNGLTGGWPAAYGQLFWSVLSDRKEEKRVEADLQRWAAAHGVKRGDICWIRYDGSARLRREPYVSKVLRVDCPENARCGETLQVAVRIENAGTATWSPSDQPPPVLGGRLMRPDSPGRWKQSRNAGRRSSRPSRPAKSSTQH